MPKWLFYSLLTLWFWGGWGVVSKVIGNSMSAAQSQALSTLGLLPVMAALGFSKKIAVGRDKRRGFFYAFAAGILVGLGNMALYEALARGGKAATLVPVTALYPLVTVLLAMRLLRERLNTVQVAGAVIALTAISLFNWGELSFSSSAFIYALIPIVLWGLGALLQKVSTEFISNELSTLYFLAAFVPIAVVIVATQSMNWSLSGKDWLCVILLGVLLGFGNLTLIAAYGSGGKASIVTPLASLYPIVTVPLAIGLLGERVSGREIAGIVLSLVGVIALTRETAPAASQSAASDATHEQIQR
ncbi:MAG: DMT family transporter [Verrucomicrobia bacterium]|nr:DMT family transporter [Verrucomicrobiota bacterium]